MFKLPLLQFIILVKTIRTMFLVVFRSSSV